ncbi:hypothetical protein NDN08_001207 [Rhodosorus marinus]|uniref:RING-type domain-containing protein n=1 Tax=Rhodosorus marinus TaxID=101924 RepID=A0AAV8URM9_9RHOD|nr:hypothetical protein NDN08_001207 [Rhodosorus marinus]
MGPPLVRTRLAVLAFQDVLREDESRVLTNNLPPGEVDLLIDGDIESIAVGYGHALVATTDGTVFAWGRNDSFGKLGIGSNEPVIVPRKPQRVHGELSEKKIVMVAAGSHHSLALSDEGTVYGWGMDEFGQTGVSSVRARNEPRAITRVPPHVKMVKIDAGWNHSAMIDENGVLYTTGVGRDGQLGVGVGENRSVPNAVTSLSEKVVDVSCGYSHTALVTESHKVYSFGVDGLRAIYISYFPIPRNVQPLSGMGIVQVASGNSFTLFLSDTGIVFAGGLNDVGQLGLGDKESRKQPVLVSALLDHFVVKVSAFTRYSVAITREGLALHWGEGILSPRIRISSIGPSLDGEAGNGILVAKARVVDKLQNHVEGGRGNVFGTPGNIGRDMSNLISDPFLLSFADVAILLDDETIPAHWFVLSARCKALRSCERRREIDLSNTSETAVRAILQFIYSNTFPQSLTIEDASNVQNLARLLDVAAVESSLEELFPNEESKCPITFDPGRECAICLMEMHTEDASRLNCGHLFHTRCVDEWLKVKSLCPVCKARVETRHLWTMMLEEGDETMMRYLPWMHGGNFLDSQLGIDLIRSLEIKGSPDVTICHGNGPARIKAHKAVLAARSKKFREILERSPDADVIYLDRISSQFMISIVKYMYVGSEAVAHLLNNWAAELLAIADSFGMSDLMGDCERYLKANLGMRDLSSLLHLASKAQAYRLRMSCLALLNNRVKNHRKFLDFVEDSVEIAASNRKTRLFRRSREPASAVRNRLTMLKQALDCEVYTLSDDEARKLIKLVNSTNWDSLAEGCQGQPRNRLLFGR